MRRIAPPKVGKGMILHACLVARPILTPSFHRPVNVNQCLISNCSALRGRSSARSFPVAVSQVTLLRPSMLARPPSPMKIRRFRSQPRSIPYRFCGASRRLYPAVDIFQLCSGRSETHGSRAAPLRRRRRLPPQLLVHDAHVMVSVCQ